MGGILINLWLLLVKIQENKFENIKDFLFVQSQTYGQKEDKQGPNKEK